MLIQHLHCATIMSKHNTHHHSVGGIHMIITVTNQKGGVAKSTTLAALTQRGYKALALDLDPQCNLSLITKANIKGGTMLSVLGEEQKAADVIQHTSFGDVIASHAGLAGADI